MESPAVLLKSAAIENDPQQRMDKVIKACKIITDLLPYDKKSQVLIEEPELMKYLMVCLPMNPRAIDLIIQTMIDKFKRIHYFLKETWFGFLHIAQLEEAENPNEKKTTPLKLLQMGIKSFLKRGGTLEDPANRPIKPQNYNDQIVKNRESIKAQVLIYVDKILVYYFNEMKQSVPFKPDVPDLFKKFFVHTISEKVINQTLDLLEKVRDIDPEFEFGDEVEEIVTSKRDSQLFLKSESSVSNLEERLSVMKRGSLAKKGSISGEATPVKGSAGMKLSKHFKKSPTKKLSVLKPGPEETKSDEEEEDITEEEDEDDEPMTAQHKYDEAATAEIEEWLANHKIADVPSIAKTAFVQEWIKDEMNIEMLVSFIVDPRFHKVTENWRIKHLSNTLMTGDDNKMSLSDLLNEGMVYSKLRDLKQLHPYILRSYKTMQLLTDDKNNKLICETGVNIIEKFFNSTYHCLKTREDIACDLNHILGLIEFYVTKEPSMCITYILHYNFPFKFLMTAEFPYVQRFFMLLLNCLPNAAELDNESYKKVLEYTRLTSLFVDISKVILNGFEQFPKDKMHLEYKPTGLAETIGFNPDILPICKIEKSTAEKKPELYPMVEDTKGFNMDIDRIQGLVQSIKKIDKKSLIAKTTGGPMRHSKIMKRYPSLVAKNFYNDTDPEIPSATNMTKNVSINESIPELLNQAKSQGSIGQLENASPTGGARLSIKLPAGGRASPQKLDPVKPTNVTSPSQGNITSPNAKTTASPSQKQAGSPAKGAGPTISSKDNSVINPKKTETMTTISPTKPSPAFATSKTYLGSNKEKGESAAPERKTYLKELDLDILGKQGLEQLKELYPTSTKNVVATPLDKEVKKPEFKVRNIKVSDQFAVRYCELLDVLFQKMLVNGDSRKSPDFPTHVTIAGLDNEELLEKYRMNKGISETKVDYNQFWKIIFGNRAEVFSNLLTNYLLKIKIHHFDDINSGYQAGQLVNTILENMSHNRYLERHAEMVQSVCRENFGFLCKTLIQSYAWPARTDVQIYLQDFQVQDPLGTGRILLTQTLYLIIKNDAENEYHIINEINDTCWHSLVNWFFTKKNNSVYQKIFYSLCELIFLHTNEKAILNILFKLNFIYNLYKAWHEIFQNNVLLKDNHVESMYAYIKLFTKLINQTVQTKEEYKVLKEQLAANASWNVLQQKLIPKPKEKKKTDKSKFKPKPNMSTLHAPPTRGETGSNSRRGDHLGNTMSSMRSGMEKNPSSAENSPTHASIRRK